MTNDLSKTPLFKQEFDLSDKNGKQSFDVNRLKGKYFVIVLNPKKKESSAKNSDQAVDIKSVTVYGEVLDELLSNSVQAEFLS